MTRKSDANRANAGRSTGPRTAAGKASSSRNAVCHGLSLSVLSDPELSAEAAELSRRIDDSCDCPLAAAVAEAHVAVRRVRRVRRDVMGRIIANPPHLPPTKVSEGIYLAKRVLNSPHTDVARLSVAWEWDEFHSELSATQAELDAAAIGALARELRRLDRYERDALARRKFAIRAFDATWAATVAGDHPGAVNGDCKQQCLRISQATPSMCLP